MEWIKEHKGALPIKSWCKSIEDKALEQAVNLSMHPIVKMHVALMADCHVGYGMPIGGVIACENAVIPNAVGSDIGCGMIAVETDINSEVFKEMKTRRELLERVKKLIPIGKGRCHKQKQVWDGFEKYIELSNKPGDNEWPTTLDRKNLGTLGGGNHFIELQTSVENKIWLMVHSGSRNLGQKIATHYHNLAMEVNQKMDVELPDKE